MITSFRDNYAFLSNFHPAPVIFAELQYPTVEHAYQAAKTLDLKQRELIRNAQTPAVAKSLGKSVTLRKDWEWVKYPTMRSLLLQKFVKGSSTAMLLLLTRPHELLEGNTWGDTYWGVVKERGEWTGCNRLGKLLMEIRSDLSK